jgi:hypothetical protein
MARVRINQDFAQFDQVPFETRRDVETPTKPADP